MSVRKKNSLIGALINAIICSIVYCFPMNFIVVVITVWKFGNLKETLMLVPIWIGVEFIVTVVLFVIATMMYFTMPVIWDTLSIAKENKVSFWLVCIPDFKVIVEDCESLGQIITKDNINKIDDK